MSRGPSLPLVSPLSSSIRKDSLLRGKEGLERELVQILALRTQTYQPMAPEGFWKEQLKALVRPEQHEP